MKKHKKKKKQQAEKLKVRFAITIIISGMLIATYPFISNLVAERNASMVIQEMNKNLEDMDVEKLDAAKEAAKKYNQQLSSAIVRDESGEGEEVGIGYVDMLGLGESIGYITIPKIHVELPIYEGTSDTVLLKGVGHLSQSSYPIGGENTHSVLTGHRGLPSAVLFTDLDQLIEGDLFYLHVLDEILAYKVDQIKVVEPNDSGDLAIIPNEDYCTLVTCTPYSINTHRLLVRGKRTEYLEDIESTKVVYQELRTGNVVRRMVDVWPWMLLAGVVVIGSELSLMMALLRRKKKRDADD